MSFLLIFIIANIVTYFSVPFIIDFFNKNNLVDKPDYKRKFHKVSTPTLGGVVVFILLLVFLFIFCGDLNEIRYFLLGLILITVIGAIDDIRGIGWITKLLFQFASAGFVVFFLNNKITGIIVSGLNVPEPFDKIILLFFIIGFINSINFFDGLDGLLSGFAFLVSSVFIILGYQSGNTFVMIITSVLLGNLLSFLKYNSYPAKIFLGDTGSLVLGLVMVTIGIINTSEMMQGQVDIAFLFILFAVPLIDMIKVVFIRLIRKKSLFMPDTNHSHHLIKANDISHKSTVFILHTYSLVYIFVAFLYLLHSQVTGLIIAATLTIIFIYLPFIIRHLQDSVIMKFLRTIRNNEWEVWNVIYNKYLVPFLGLLILVHIIYLFPLNLYPEKNIIFVFLIITTLILIYNITNKIRKKPLIEIFIFYNFVIFAFSALSSTNIINTNIENIPLGINVTYLIILLIILAVINFIVFKEKYVKRELKFITGLELLILVFILLLFILPEILSIGHLKDAGKILFYCFMIYLFIKVLYSLYERLMPTIFFASFLLAYMPLVKSLLFS